MITNYLKLLPCLYSEDKGGIAILTALLFTVLAGFAGLAIDVGLWYSQGRQLQIAADAGAVGGAFALSKGQNVTTYATYDAGLNGCTSANHCTITVSNPPTSGTYAGNTSAIQVTLSQQATGYLSPLLGITAPDIKVTAVATGSTVSSCLTLLGTTGTDLSLSNGASVSLVEGMSSCGVTVNSSSGSAVSVTGGATLNVEKLAIVGGDQVNNGGSINTSPTANNIVTGVPAVTNPLSGFTVPSPSGPCTSSINVGGGQTTSENPGVYCGITIGNGATVTLNPGIYYIDNKNGTGNLTIDGGSTVKGTGVTIIMTNTTSSNSPFGTITIDNGTTVTLSPPTTGSTAGLTLISDPNPLQPLETETIAGGATLNISGTLYFPNSAVSFSNGASATNACLQLIASTATFSGGSTFGNVCAAGQSALGSNSIQLVQ